MARVRIGRQYNVRDRRRGCFQIRVTECYNGYIRGAITQGTAPFLDGTTLCVGDAIWLGTAKSSITFEAVNSACTK